MRISDWSSDVCSSDLVDAFHVAIGRGRAALALRHGGQAHALREVEQAGLGSFDDPDQGVPAGGEAEPVPLLRAARDEGSAALLACHQARSEEHTSELQSLMRISYAVFCLKKQNKV